MKYFFCIETPLGKLTALEEEQRLTALLWGETVFAGCCRKTDLLAKTEAEIKAYFRKELTRFSIPCLLRGTDFQKAVWQALAQVPYGTTLSYQELAQRSGHPQACRAVGTACSNNPINLIIPCHRIVNKNGTAGNYRGGAERKKSLLLLEKDNLPLFSRSVINL